MRQPYYGLALFIFLILPPVATLAESIMAIHMHMQMPLIAVSGMLMYPLIKKILPSFFSKWNHNGIPGILLVIIVSTYWLIPRAMDDAIISTYYETFKFISWAFLIGLPLRDSWKKLKVSYQNIFLLYISFAYLIMALIYIVSEDQLCNNYLIVDQRTLGWSFLLISLCIWIYVIQIFISDWNIRKENRQVD